MKFVSQTFLKGLAVTVPIAAVAYLVYWLAGDAEAAIRGLLLSAMPEQYYVPGLGILLVLGTIFCIGLLMYPWLTRVTLEATDRGMRKIPLIGAVYAPVRDLMDMVGGGVGDSLNQVVMVQIPQSSFEMLGFLMQDDTAQLPDGFPKDDHVVVYLQMSYQIGGYCFVVPRESIRPVDMSVQQAIRWVLMGGLSS